MKRRLIVPLVVLALSSALPTFAQQTDTPDPQLRQSLLGLAKKFEEAWNNNDADALAALFTKDAVVIDESGPVYGREAIRKYYADLFQNVHFSDNHTMYNDPKTPHAIGTNGNMMWENGEWSMTWQVKGGEPVQGKGYDASIAVLEDGVWKKRLLINNVIHAPAATATTQQTNKPDPQFRERLISRIKAHTDALDRNDAAAVAANFTEDGILVTPGGTIFGREAIEKYYVDVFKQVHLSNNLAPVDEDSPHITTDGKQMWATGSWTATIKGQNFGPVDGKGYWSVIREGDDWNIRMLTFNQTPAPAAAASPTASPSNQ